MKPRHLAGLMADCPHPDCLSKVDTDTADNLVARVYQLELALKEIVAGAEAFRDHVNAPEPAGYNKDYAMRGIKAGADLAAALDIAKAALKREVQQ